MYSTIRNLSSSAVRRRVVFSGIQPTGTPHLGNYFGALSNWVALQKNAQPEDTLLFSIVGWHALTLPQDPIKLSQSRIDMMAILLAIGLNPSRSIIFHQDHNLHHVELAWLLDCQTSMGKLRRMHGWKARIATSQNLGEGADVEETAANAGLFTYPVLMSADILLYQTTHVPVGQDQKQHVELCRDIAEQFNRDTKENIFSIPDVLNTPSKRILSLRDPTSKMSKSAPDPASRILFTDDAATIRSKVRVAVTDSVQGITYDPVNRAGTSNLLTILAACMGEDVVAISQRYADKNHGLLKNDVVEAIEETLKGPRSEYERLRNDRGYLESVAMDGAVRARELSSVTIRKVRQKLGLFP